MKAILAKVLSFLFILHQDLVVFGGVQPDPVQVQIESGTISGVRTQHHIAWKGIPFAQPPLGSLRWRAPQPVKAWTGVLKTEEFQADCIQPRKDISSSTMMSEDCLYLNVWRPAAEPEKPLPVMVWIYGGGLVTGGSSLYPGDFLARQGIVVVTLNYRLGRFGFFAHPALALEHPNELRGNYGYMDQIAALRWVSRNIAAFHGDPKNISIAGESAGCGSVLVMLTSPLASGLFHKAILQSPGIPTPRAAAAPMRELFQAESIAVEYAKSLGIHGRDRSALQKLRSLSVDAINNGTSEYITPILGGPEISGLSHSIIDGELVVESPEKALRGGRHARVPIIVGANDADLAESPAQTKDALFAQFGTLASKARVLYDPTHDRKLDDLIQDIISDKVMLEPSRFLAEKMTEAGQPAYFYRFSYVPKSKQGTVPGATHAAELPFMLDAVAQVMGMEATDEDIRMGHIMSSYWTAFVRTGIPNGGDRVYWPRFELNQKHVLNFTNSGVVFGPDPRKNRLDLWRAVWDACTSTDTRFQQPNNGVRP